MHLKLICTEDANSLLEFDLVEFKLGSSLNRHIKHSAGFGHNKTRVYCEYYKASWGGFVLFKDTWSQEGHSVSSMTTLVSCKSPEQT